MLGPQHRRIDSLGRCLETGLAIDVKYGERIREVEIDSKTTVKSVVVCCCVAPLGLSERLARSIFYGDVLFESHGELLRLVPGKIGRYLRNAYYGTQENCPPDGCFLLGSAFTHSNARVGHRLYIGSFSQVGCASTHL